MNELDPSPAPPSPRPRRRAGRPRKGEGPQINHAELDQLLVFGEPAAPPGGAIRYPSYRELAARYGVANSVIADYARKNRCQRRRKYVAAKIRARADERQIDLRANALAAGHADTAPSPVEIVQGARLEVLSDVTAASPPAAL
jgi:hypothetical protein